MPSRIEVSEAKKQRIRECFIDGWTTTDTSSVTKIPVARVSALFTGFRQQGITPHSEIMQKLLCSKFLGGEEI